MFTGARQPFRFKREVIMQPSDSRQNPIVDTAWFPWVLTAGLTVAATCVVLLAARN